MIQYLFEGPEVEPHVNFKVDCPFFLNSIINKGTHSANCFLKHTKGSTVRAFKREGGEGGEEIEASGIAMLPLDCQQVKYAQQEKAAKTCDPLYSIMLKCTLAQVTSEVFIQDMKAAPFPTSVCCLQLQLQDMLRFLTCNHEFGVLTVDIPYELGEFYVTLMTYQHFMVEDTKTKWNPVMLGPILFHQKVDFSAFNYFVSMLVGLEKQLKNVLAFGKDGDRNLVEVSSHNFPNFVVSCTSKKISNRS